MCRRYCKNIIKIQTSGKIELLMEAIPTKELVDYVVIFYDENGKMVKGIGQLVQGTTTISVEGFEKGKYYFEIKRKHEDKKVIYRSELIGVAPGEVSETSLTLPEAETGRVRSPYEINLSDK